MIRALRDPDGANLDRVQVIKGWLDSKGETQERIYDATFYKIDVPDTVPAMIQSRAYTSPIWYTT
jgi:hypothetical protein